MVSTSAISVGSLVKAGLPNITGGIGWVWSWTGDAWGAFYLSNSANSPQGSGMNLGRDFNFNASRSSSIYGSSSTVTPSSLKVGFYISY